MLKRMQLRWALWKLQSKDVQARHWAIESLGQIADTEAIEALLAILKHQDAYTRCKAVRVLGDAKNARAVEPLMIALRDADKDVRKMAVQALCKLGDARAIESLIAVLQDTDETVRESAAETLGMLGDTRAVDPLGITLQDTDQNVRYHTVVALGMLGNKRAVELLVMVLQDSKLWKPAGRELIRLGWEPQDDSQRAWLAVVREDWKQIVSLGTVAVKPLLAAAHSHREEWEPGRMHGEVWNTLCQLGNAVVEPLMVALRDTDEGVREMAVRALCELTDTRAVEALTAALQDTHYEVRRHAARALGQLRDARAVNSLVDALQDTDHGVRREAALALGQMGSVWAVEPLIAVLTTEDGLTWNPSETIRQHVAAMRVLGKIKDPRVVEALIPVLTDKREWKWGSEGSRSRQMEAANALGRSNDSRAVEPLLRATLRLPPLWREVVCQAAAQALEQMEDDCIFEGMVPALKDINLSVRQAAAQNLIARGWMPTDDKQHALLLVALQQWEEASSMGLAAVEPLKNALKGGNYSAGLAAYSALEQIPGNHVSEEETQELVEALAAEVLSLRSRTRTEHEFGSNPGIGRSQASQTLVGDYFLHEVPDPDYDGIQALEAVIPKPLYERVRKQTP